MAITFFSGGCDTSRPVTGLDPANGGSDRIDGDQLVAINPENWPIQSPVFENDHETERFISGLMERMTIEEKVGQVIQADIGSIEPWQLRKYKLGSILNGGGSAPDGNLRNTPDSWLELADEFWEASTDTSDGGLGIPVIWGTDAVHGHANIVGATVFPHNIGLGAANDPNLMYEIGRVTALEMLATGLDWTFAPTIAVVRNDRWGRTYEGYSEDPRIVEVYAPRIVEGIQGKLGTEEFLSEGRMIATIKHFVGDGGTVDGIDQGDNFSSESDLRNIHAAGYGPAIAAGVQVVMASYNSFYGRKMHGHKEMLTDVLVGRMGFDGFTVGDWNGHGHVRGCSNISCAHAFNAGLDMFMAPDSWEELYWNTVKQVRSGEISLDRLDQAVARILRVKVRAGVFESPRPSERTYAGNWDLLGAPEHRAVARKAVRKSLVLLKNNDEILPLRGSSRVLVSGDGAHDIGKQSGGWTLSWQGTGNDNSHFPNGNSIYEGLAEALREGGGEAVLSVDGSWTEKPDVAVVVFGEDPYAEFQGDRTSVMYSSDDGLALLKSFREDGIPTVSVFISGRPMWINRELNASDAFVAAWLPGSEGVGVADVLVGDAGGEPRHDFTGRLSFSWPATADQVEVNVGDEPYEPLFAYGYGLSYGEAVEIGILPENPGQVSRSDKASSVYIEFGDSVGPWRLNLSDRKGNALVSDARGSSPAGVLSIRPADHEMQEDTFLAKWTGPARLFIDGPRVNLQRETTGDLVLSLNYRVTEANLSQAHLSMSGGAIDVTTKLTSMAGEGWRTSHVKLSCFAESGANMESVHIPFMLTVEGRLEVQIASVMLAANQGRADCEL